MTGQLAERWKLAVTGAVGAALLWSVVEAADGGLIGDRLALVLLALVGVALASALAMAGPIGLARALPRSLGLGALVAALVWLGSLRHDPADAFFNSPLPSLAALTVAALPIPFLIAQARGTWNDYAALFLEAWSIVVRYAAAWAFTGLVWLVIFLSDQVLGIVGIDVIANLLDHWIVPMLITGAVLGLGMAVVHELAELLSPYLVLRLFRLLVPPVLGVMVIFVLALPIRGIEGLFSGLPPALLMLAMVGAGIGLVAIAVDQGDADAAQSLLVLRAAQGMALILPVMGGFAAWAVWLRVAQHGWTPERLFIALVAAIGLAYALLYSLAVLRGAGWMRRVRQANVGMALVVIAIAALWLTPVLNAEAISARDQLTRFEAGQTEIDDLDVAALQSWGKPGAKALAALAARAQGPGQEALAARLAGSDPTEAPVLADLVAELAALIVLQPPTAGGTRDTLLAGAQSFQLEDWIARCSPGPTGEATCLMVVADLLPGRPGEEAMFVLAGDDRFAEVVGLFLDETGMLQMRNAVRADGGYIDRDAAQAMLDSWQSGAPPLTPALINQLGTGETGLMIQP